jgi:hypothetical protein
VNEYYADILGFSKGGMPPRNKKEFPFHKKWSGNDSSWGYGV